jgi:hypothetical protein
MLGKPVMADVFLKKPSGPPVVEAFEAAALLLLEALVKCRATGIATL